MLTRHLKKSRHRDARRGIHFSLTLICHHVGMFGDTFRWPGVFGVVSILLLAVAVLMVLSLPADAGKQCSRIDRVSGFETLVNTCNACLSVQVVRDRGGAASATLRTFQMVRKGEFPLPFKGSGRTRIVSEESCGGTSAQEKASTKSVAKRNKACIIPVRTGKGVAMANSCSECRSFIIERLFENGERSNKPYALAGQQSLPLAPEGAVRAEIVHETACKT